MAKRGRKKGLPNLKRVEGGFVNQHGVFFTTEQRKALERATAKSNRIRDKQIKEEAARPIKNAGRVIVPDRTQLHLMHGQSDMILSHQYKSLQHFKSMEDYEDYMTKQSRIHSGDYLDDKARLYKRNFMESLLDTYGDEAKDIAMKVRMMKPQEYMQLVEDDEVLEIRYVPSDMRVPGRLNQLRAALGMKPKDEWYDEEYDEE